VWNGSIGDSFAGRVRRRKLQVGKSRKAGLTRYR
jgi:hypothetical protein